MKPDIDYSLYLVTDRDLMSTETLEEAVEAACKGGVTLVQLREKSVSDEEYAEIARSVKDVCDRYGIPLIINDNPKVAAAVGAAGVHVGQEDLDAALAREVMGPSAIVGVSAGSIEEAQAAEAAGADYLGVGATTFTATKPEANVLTLDEMRAIVNSVSIPVVAIGGVNEETIPKLAGMGLAGYSLVSAIMAAPDVEDAGRRLKRLIEAQGR